MAYSPLRYCYWFAAVTVSIFGLATALLEVSQGTVSRSCNNSGLRLYIGHRAILGIAQLILHLGVLLPARTSHAGTQKFEMTKDPNVFYHFVNVCNVALVISIIVGVWVRAGYLSCQSKGVALDSYIALENGSLAIWIAVLVARIIAIATDNVKNWFFLDWPLTTRIVETLKGDINKLQ